MSELRQTQLDRNRASRDLWEGYAEHREQVSRCLLKAVGDNNKLCILGAGNCNDFDLNVLRRHYAELHLVDLDADAMRSGVERQGVGTSSIFLHGDVDVTGAMKSWEERAQSRSTDVSVSQLQERLEEPPALELPGDFDCVASIGLISQLIDSLTCAVGRDHPQLNALVVALRDQHLRLLANLTTAGGAAWWITDFVSSDTCEELLTVTASGMPDLSRRLLQAGNFFTGLNPMAVVQRAVSDPEIAAKFAAPKIGPPWRWRMGPRAYAVYAMHLPRRGSDD